MGFIAQLRAGEGTFAEIVPIERDPDGIHRWRWTAICCALIAAVVACLAVDAVFDRNFSKNINEGVAYLDMAYGLAAGHPGALLNSYWSPGYPVVLSIGLTLLHPSPARELAAIYAIDAAIGVLAFCCLIYFVTGLPTPSDRAGMVGLTRPMLLAVASALFLVAVQADAPVYLMTPDLLLAAFLWLAGGAFLRVAQRQRIDHYVILALALALAYFTKAAALVLVIAAAAILPFTGASRKRAIRGGLVYVGVAALLIAPYVAKLSSAKGRFTFGDSGSLNYAWIVDGADGPNRWHMENDSPHGHARMQLSHPARRLLTSPGVYEYASPIQGTFPTFDDPSYWDEGLKPAFYLKGEIWHLAMNGYHTLSWFGRRGEFVVALLVLLVVQRHFRASGVFRETLPVLLWFASLWGVYLLVDVEDRYVFAVLTAVLLLAAAGVRLPASGTVRRMLAICTVLVACGAGIRSLDAAGHKVFYGIRPLFVGSINVRMNAVGPYQNPYWEAAQILTGKLGLHANDSVACMQLGCDNSYWARLAGLRITADISSETDYWTHSPEERAKAMAVLSEDGVKALVTRHLGAGAESEGWVPLYDPHETPAEELYARLTK